MPKLEELLKYEQPTKYTVDSTEYDDNFKIPVLTPGQTFILGYTNEEENVFDANKEPIILFDDFTTAVKYVDFPFKVKSSACKILHATEECDIKYAYYLLKSLKIDVRTHKRYWISNVSQIEVPKISKEKQQEIAEALTRIEEAIKKSEMQLQDIEKLIDNKFEEMFGNPITNNRNWKMVQMDTVATIVSGSTPDTKNEEYWAGNYNWVTPAEISDETFYVKDTVRKITEKGITKSGLKIMPKGTILFSSRAPIGKTAIAGVEMYCNQGFKNFICNEKINNYYLFYLLRRHKDYFDSLGTGATFRELSKSTISKIEIALPDMGLQEEFANVLIDAEKYKEILRKNIQDLNDILNNQMEKYFK